MTIDERIEALTMNMELQMRDTEQLKSLLGRLITTVEQLAAVRSHEERLQRGNL